MSPRHARSLAALTPFALARLDGPGAYVDGPRRCSSGGAGLLSTARDYSRLLQMIRNGGTLEGVRLLGPETVELMTSNHLGDLHDEGRTGFGRSFEITGHVGRTGGHRSVGKFLALLGQANEGPAQ